jgi:hypothetical protein
MSGTIVNNACLHLYIKPSYSVHLKCDRHGKTIQSEHPLMFLDTKSVILVFHNFLSSRSNILQKSSEQYLNYVLDENKIKKKTI